MEVFNRNHSWVYRVWISFRAISLLDYLIMKQSDENLIIMSKRGARTFNIERYFQTKDGQDQLEKLIEIEKLSKNTREDSQAV